MMKVFLVSHDNRLGRALAGEIVGLSPGMGISFRHALPGEEIKRLAEAGLIELTLTKPTSRSAVMRVLHNPARDRVNEVAGIEPAFLFVEQVDLALGTQNSARSEQ